MTLYISSICQISSDNKLKLSQMLPYANIPPPPPLLFDASSSCFANNIHGVGALPPLAFVDAYNFPFFGFETPLPPPEDGTNGGGRRKRRRGQRNDRHSKIRTTKGLRDRRMRLSVDIAGRFFALQDLLGFEKASATIDWLLRQSGPAIERAALRASVFPPRGSTVPSALLINVPACCFPESTELSEYSLRTTPDHVDVYEKAEESPPSPLGRISPVPTVSRRGSRDDARARARCRTVEKKKKTPSPLVEEEDGGIGGQFDSTEQLPLCHYSMEEVLPSPPLAGSDVRTAANAENSSSSSFSQGSKLADDHMEEYYNFGCLPKAVDCESSPLCMFGYHQSKDFPLICNDTDASYGLVFQEDYMT